MTRTGGNKKAQYWHDVAFETLFIMTYESTKREVTTVITIDTSSNVEKTFVHESSVFEFSSITIQHDTLMKFNTSNIGKTTL